MGVKSRKAKIFEEFYCPKCKKNTTLFLPSVKVEKPKLSVVEKSTPITPTPVVVKNKSNFLTIKEIIIFIIGFITALLITKN